MSKTEERARCLTILCRDAVRLRGLVTTCVVVACVALTGCMALRLSGRGAPDGAFRELTVDLEPMDLPAGTVGHEVQHMLKPAWITVPESGWVHGWEYSLTDATGQAAPQGALHHFKVLNPDTRELFSEVMQHVIAAGKETAPVTLRKELGYRVEAGDSLLVTGMLHNPTDRELRGLHLKVTIRYSPEGPWQPPLDVVPFFAHVMADWQSVSYDLPPGRSQRSVEIVPTIDGRVLAFGGHLHRWGIALLLQSLPDERVIWAARAPVADDGEVLDIPQDHFVWSRGPRMRKDRTYRLTAVYHNPTGATIVEGGMATLVGLIVPEEPWPEVDRGSEEYRWYLARELEGMGAHHRDR